MCSGMDTFQALIQLPEVMNSDRCLVVAILNMSWEPTKQCSDLRSHFICELAPLVLLEQELLTGQPVLPFSKHMYKSSRTKPVWVQSGLGEVRLSPEAARKTWGVASSLLQTSPDVTTPKIPEEDAGAPAVEEQAGRSKARDDENVPTMFWKAILAGVSPIPLWEATGMHAVANTGPTHTHQDSTCLLDF